MKEDEQTPPGSDPSSGGSPPQGETSPDPIKLPDTLPLTPPDGFPLRGRLIGLLRHWNEGLVACVQVPCNGLWGYRADDIVHRPGENDSENHWLSIEPAGCGPEPLIGWQTELLRLGAWVEARPNTKGPKTRWVIEELPPRRVRLVWRRTRVTPPPGDRWAPRVKLRPTFPDDPDLDEWARCFEGTGWNHAPELLEHNGRMCVSICDREDPYCHSVFVDVRHSDEPGWVVLREISCGHDDGWELMPWLEVRVDAPVEAGSPLPRSDEVE